MYRFVLAMLFLVSASLLPAYTQCEQLVDDQANVFGAKAPQVQQAVDKLVSDTGADVHVFTVSSMGTAASFEKYVYHMIETCPGWQGVNGDIKNNLIIVGVALKERKTAIIYGPEWGAALDSQHQRIQATNMNSRFKGGDFAGGFVAGLNEINRVVVAFQHPTVPGQSAPMPVPSSTPDIHPASTTNVDFSGLLTVIGWILLLAVVAVVSYAFYRWLQKFSEKRSERMLAQQRAIRARQKIMERALSSEPRVGEVGAEIFSLRQVVCESDTARAREFFAEAESACKEGLDLHMRLLQTSSDPEQSGLTAGQYDDMFREYSTVEQVFAAMDESLRSATLEIKMILRLVESTQETIKAAEAAVIETEKFVEKTKADGLQVPMAEEAIEDARKLFDEARESLDHKDYGDLMTKLTAATAAVNRADGHLLSVLQKRADCAKATIRLGKTMLSAPQTLEQACAMWATSSGRFHSGDANLVNEHFAEIRSLVTSATEQWEQCKFFESVQNWDSALEMADKSEKTLAKILEMCETINKLPETLTRLEAELGAKLDRTEALVKRLSEFTREHQNELSTDFSKEVEKFERRLASLTKNVKGSRIGVAEITDTADTLIEEGESALGRAVAAVRKVEQGRARAHDRNRSARSTSRGSDRGNNKSKDKSDKKGKSKDDRRGSRDRDDDTAFVGIDNSSSGGISSGLGSSSGSGSSGRSNSSSRSSGGGDSDWGSSSSGGGSSDFGGGGGGGGGDSSW